MARTLERRIKKLEQLKRDRAPQSKSTYSLFGLTEREAEEASKIYFSAKSANIDPLPPASFGREQQAAFFELVALFRKLDDEF